jgi:hypothetical protein
VAFFRRIRWFLEGSAGKFSPGFHAYRFCQQHDFLCKSRAEAGKTIAEATLFQKIEHKVLNTRKYSLNAENPPGKPDIKDIVKDLKHLMNILRGAYFRVAEGRIAYEEMAESKIYHEYVKCSLSLWAGVN